MDRNDSQLECSGQSCPDYTCNEPAYQQYTVYLSASTIHGRRSIRKRCSFFERYNTHRDISSETRFIPLNDLFDLLDLDASSKEQAIRSIDRYWQQDVKRMFTYGVSGSENDYANHDDVVHVIDSEKCRNNISLMLNQQCVAEPRSSGLDPVLQSFGAD